MLVFALIWAGAAAAYVLFAGQFSPDELAAAVVCGFVASAWSEALRRAAAVRLRFPHGSAAAAGRAMAGLFPGALKVGGRLARALVRRTDGQMIEARFDEGRLTDPEDVGRRAVAVIGRSLAPDSFVVRTPRGEDKIIIHSLLETQAAVDPQWAV